MKIAAIICEYNPLHNGHIHHINATRQLTGCDALICVMSGNFTQRGDAACMDKYTRAVHAVKCGADAVVELPCLYATSSAEFFARGAVGVLSLIEGVTHLSFGSECGDIDKLKSAVAVTNSDNYRCIIRRHLDNGTSYPIAAALAYGECCTEPNLSSTPNNILACEYIKAINDICPSITPVTIVREGGGYHDMSIAQFSSASAIRNAVSLGASKGLSMPEYALVDMLNAPKIDTNRIFAIVCNKLLSPLPDTYEGQEGLINRLANCSKTATCLDELIDLTHTKRYTKSRIRRLITHVLLSHTTDTARAMPDYTNVLAISGSKLDLLRQMTVRKSDSILYQSDMNANEIYRIIGGSATHRNSHVIVK